MSEVRIEKYQPTEIRNATDKSEVRVFKLDLSGSPTIETYQFDRIIRPGERDYSANREKYGSLSSLDAEDVGSRKLEQKNNRFRVNTAVKEALAIQEEEKRLMQAEVKKEIDSLSEAAKIQGAERGFQEGLKRGHVQAYEEFRSESKNRLEYLEEWIKQLDNAKSELFRANERFLIELIFRIGKMLFLKDLSADREYVTRLTREIIENIGVRENIRVRINPAEFETTQILSDALATQIGALKNLHVEATESVPRGGVEVETQWNRIDARIETQLDGLYRSIFGISDVGVTQTSNLTSLDSATVDDSKGSPGAGA